MPHRKLNEPQKPFNDPDGIVEGARRLLLKVELAYSLRVTTRTIENREREGLPVVRIGRSIRYDLDEVLAWLKDPSSQDRDQLKTRKKAYKPKRQIRHSDARR